MLYFQLVLMSVLPQQRQTDNINRSVGTVHLTEYILKPNFTEKSNAHISALACGDIYPSPLFWCEQQSFGDIDGRDVCLLWNTTELNGGQFPVLKRPEDTFVKLNSNIDFQKSLPVYSR